MIHASDLQVRLEIGKRKVIKNVYSVINAPPQEYFLFESIKNILSNPVCPDVVILRRLSGGQDD